MTTITQLEWQAFDEKNPPTDELVLVYNPFSGIHLRTFRDNGDCYDSDEIYDDSEIKWHFWCAIPGKP